MNFSEFLKSHIPPQKGPIVDIHGNILGEHDGAFQYTIGQRKGIAVGGGPALYVLEKNIENNTLVVGVEDDERLFHTSCTLVDMNWLADVDFPLSCEAQIRYRQHPQKCLLRPENDSSISVIFDAPQRAISPGQVCALYDGERVLGSGIISTSF